MKVKKIANWGPTIFLISYQVLLLAALPFYFYYHSLSLSLLAISIVLLYATGLSITVGYHRYYAHKSYKTNSFIESLLLFFGAMAFQGSALRWAFDHRIHHAFVDTDDDPYSINKGFLYAHFTWIFEKPAVIDRKVVSDLFKNKLVMFQHDHIGKLMLGTNILAWAFVGWILNDYLGAFVIGVGLRMFALHHFTWFINSLAHMWGDKPFSQEQTAVDNYFLAFLTFGEGYHNFHHTFANDYRNGIRWFHWDPSKWCIWTLSKLGLAHNLKTIDPLTIKKRMVIEHKNLLLDRLKQAWNEKKEELEQQIQEITDGMVAKLTTFNQLSVQYQQFKREQASRDLIAELGEEIKGLRKSLKDDWRHLKQLSNDILGDNTQQLQT